MKQIYDVKFKGLQPGWEILSFSASNKEDVRNLVQDLYPHSIHPIQSITLRKETIDEHF